MENVGEPIDVEVGLDGGCVIDDIWGLPWALRGAWPADDTFVVEYQLIGLEPRGSIQFRFRDDIARTTFLETVTEAAQWSTSDRVG